MRIVKVSPILLLLVALVGCSGLDIHNYKIKNSAKEQLRFYISHANDQKLSNKLIIMIQGSSHSSVRRRFGMIENFFPAVDVLYMEKYAIDNDNVFWENNYRQRRIHDISSIIRHVTTEIYKNKLKQVYIVADSEGGVIAPEIAVGLSDTITYLIILGAGGYSQSREFEILLEKELKQSTKGMFWQVGISSREQLQQKFDLIRNKPSHKKFWLGHSHKYWNSYLWYSPEQYISRLHIPILYVIGNRDESVPVETVLYLQNKLSSKKNISFYVAPGLDHRFTNQDGNNKINEIIEQVVIPWFEDKPSTRKARQ